MLAFLKSNAMQVAGAAQAIIAIIVSFTHLSTVQTAALVGFPSALGTFLAGLVLSSQKTSTPSTPPPAAPPPAPPA